MNKKLDKVNIELDSLKNKTENPEYEIKAPKIAKEKDRYVFEELFYKLFLITHALIYKYI